MAGGEPAAVREDRAGAPDPPISRRRFLRRLALASATMSAGGAALYHGTRSIETVRETVVLPGLRRRLRAVILSDLHLCTHRWVPLFASRAYVGEVARRAAAERPDLLLFGGDLATPRQGGIAAAGEALDILGGIAAPLGAWAALGNHDIKYEREALVRHFERSGVRLLSAEWQTVDGDHGSLAIGGVVFRRDPLALRERLAPPPEADARILLAHDPAIVYDLGSEAGWCDLIVSGHTHGGQVVLPLIGSPWAQTPANPDYMRGRFHLAEGPVLYVNRGIGTVLAPFRLGSRPEITVLELAPGANGAREGTAAT